MPQVGFEPTIAAGERPQSYALDRAVTGIGGLGIIYFACYDSKYGFIHYYKKSAALPTQFFTKFSNAQQYYMQIS
jgi:hypothetical protein